MGLLDQSFVDSLLPQTDEGGGSVFVTIRVDGDCFLRCDGEFVDAEFKAGKITKIELPVGQHILEFQLAANPDVVIERVVDYPERGKSYLEIVQGVREKTDAEKKADAIAEFEKMIQECLADDMRIDSQEANRLEEERKRLGLDTDTASRLINQARRAARQGSRNISNAASKAFSLDALKEAVIKDDVDKLLMMLPDAASAIETSEQGSPESKAVQFWYFMCMAALQPKELIHLHESSFIDNYWRSFWVMLAYSRNNHRSEATDILLDLQDIYAEYPEGNLDLLKAIDALNNIDKKEASKSLDNVGDAFSPDLAPVIEAVKYELGLAQHASKQSEQKYAFLQDRVVSFEAPEKRAERKEKEKDALRKQVTYTISIVEVKDSKAAVLTTRKAFGWAEAVSKIKLARLPLIILVTGDKTKALSLCETLEKGGLRVETTGINALGENVDDCLGLKKKAELLKAETVKKYKELERQVLLNRPLFIICKDHLYGYMDITGKEVIPCQYDEAYDFREGLARVKIGDKIVFINKMGEEVISCGYKMAYDFNNGLSRIWDKNSGKYGFMDKTGREAIRLIFDNADDFNEGMAKVERNGKYGFINTIGQEIVRCKYQDACTYHDGLAWVVEEDNLYFIDKTGHEVIDGDDYCGFSSFSEGRAFVQDENLEYGFIDKQGREVIECEYDKAGGFHEGLSWVKKNGKCGFIDKQGRVVIKFRYDGAGNFHEGLAVVKNNGKCGYIDKEGKEIVACKYDKANPFRDGLAKVELDGKFWYVDKTGKEVTRINYEASSAKVISCSYTTEKKTITSKKDTSTASTVVKKTSESSKNTVVRNVTNELLKSLLK